MVGSTGYKELKPRNILDKLDGCKRVRQLENAALSGWYVPSKTKYCKKTDSAQVV